MPFDLSRQKDLFPTGSNAGTATWPGLAEARFTIVGCGGIGSNLANLVARLGGRRFALFDPDEVAEENVAPGWFLPNEIGYKKVEVIQTALDCRFGIISRAANEKFSGQLCVSDVVLVCTDSMDSRRAAWENRGSLAGWQLWVDCRMGCDQCSVYTVYRPPGYETQPSKEYATWQSYVSSYEAVLDLPDAPLPCGMKATAALTVGMLPGLVGTVLYRVCNGRLPPLHLFYKMADAFLTCVEPKGV